MTSSINKGSDTSDVRGKTSDVRGGRPIIDQSKSKDWRPIIDQSECRDWRPIIDQSECRDWKDHISDVREWKECYGPIGKLESREFHNSDTKTKKRLDHG
jgi:hypothetical protein